MIRHDLIDVRQAFKKKFCIDALRKDTEFGGHSRGNTDDIVKRIIKQVLCKDIEDRPFNSFTVAATYLNKMVTGVNKEKLTFTNRSLGNIIFDSSVFNDIAELKNADQRPLSGILFITDEKKAVCQKFTAKGAIIVGTNNNENAMFDGSKDRSSSLFVHRQWVHFSINTGPKPITVVNRFAQHFSIFTVSLILPENEIHQTAISTITARTFRDLKYLVKAIAEPNVVEVTNDDVNFNKTVVIVSLGFATPETDRFFYDVAQELEKLTYRIKYYILDDEVTQEKVIKYMSSAEEHQKNPTMKKTLFKDDSLKFTPGSSWSFALTHVGCVKYLPNEHPHIYMMSLPLKPESEKNGYQVQILRHYGSAQTLFDFADQLQNKVVPSLQRQPSGSLQ